MPGLSNVFVMPIKTRIDMLTTGIRTPVGIKVTGPSLAALEDVGRRIEQAIRTVPGTTSVYAERVTGARYVDVRVDRHRAARFGLNVSDVQDAVETAIGGMNVTETIEGRERYPVNLRYPSEARDSLERSRRLPVIVGNGLPIALGEVAEIRIVDGPDMIRSENARLSGWTYVDFAGRDIAAYIADAKRAVAEQVRLPPGYALSWSGQYEYLERAAGRLKVVIPFTVAIILLLLYLNFRNGMEVLIIVATLPLALVGGFWLLWALGYHLSVAVAVGFIALGGVAVEIGVVMLAYLDQAMKRRREARGEALTREDVHEAIVEGALLRVRPVTMTKVAIIAALLPILWSLGHRLRGHAAHRRPHGRRHAQRGAPHARRDPGRLSPVATGAAGARRPARIAGDRGPGAPTGRATVSRRRETRPRRARRRTAPRACGRRRSRPCRDRAPTPSRARRRWRWTTSTRRARR